MAQLRTTLLRLAIPSVTSTGFTRQTLANSVLSLSKPHSEPLSESTVSSLFGEGDEARRTLINAWFEDARSRMRESPDRGLKGLLKFRLEHNEPVMHLLPEAFALILSPSGIPFVDLRPAFAHPTSIADAACHIAGDQSIGPAWYARRASLAAVYTAAELHQLSSPETAYGFLEELLDKSTAVEEAVTESRIFVDYIGKSWTGIIKSQGFM